MACDYHSISIRDIFMQQITNDRRKPSFDILNSAVAPHGFHTSGERFDPPKCHPNTRVAVLKKIMDWILRYDIEVGNRSIMWLTGAAGAGKSAILESLCELCREHEVHEHEVGAAGSRTYAIMPNLIELYREREVVEREVDRHEVDRHEMDRHEVDRHEVVEHKVVEHKVMIATFFFSRHDSTRNHTGSLIATLVYQIYHSVPAAQRYILSAIATDPLIFNKSVEYQFSQLVIKTLDIVCSSSTSWIPGSYCVIAIDGLDECIDREEQLQLLNIIFDAVQRTKLPILFLIASRPEHEIRSAFASKEKEDIYIPLFLDETYNPDDDIRIFLQYNFHEIKKTHPFKRDIPEIWPSPDTLEGLVKKSSGQFIYAAIVIRYVQSMRHRPDHRLDIMIGRRSASGYDQPFAELDNMFAMIIHSAVHIEQVLYAVSLYTHKVFQDSQHDVCEFMSLDDIELEMLFCDLGSLFSVEPNLDPKKSDRPGARLRFLHASLHDFFMDPSRSKEFYVSLEVYRTRHIANILHYIALAANDEDYMHTENRFKSVIGFFRRESPLCRESSPDLLERAISFPLAKILHKAVDNQSPLVPFFLFFDLFPFFRQMAVFDKEWISVEKHHKDGLDGLFLPGEFAHSAPEWTSNGAKTFLALPSH